MLAKDLFLHNEARLVYVNDVHYSNIFTFAVGILSDAEKLYYMTVN